MCKLPRDVSKSTKRERAAGERIKYEPISITIDEDLLAKIKERAAALNLNVSQYLRALAAQDVSTRGDLVLRETPPPYGEKKKTEDDKK
jgi:hypothetical protein